MSGDEVVPLETLLGNPERATPRISPDGRRIAYLAPDEGVLNIWVGDARGEHARPVTRDRDRGLGHINWVIGTCWYFWAHDNRHLIVLRDQGGNENYHVIRIDPETDETLDLTPFDGVQAQIVATDPRFPDQILVALNRDNPVLHDVYRLNIATGDLTKVAENSLELGIISLAGLGGWLADRELRVRGGMRLAADGGLDLLVRDAEDEPWRTALHVDFEDALTTRAARFTADGKGLWLMNSVGSDTARLVRHDLVTGESTLVASDPDYDVSNVVFHPGTHEPQFAIVYKDRASIVVLDRAIEGDLASIRELHPGDFSILDRDHADATWIVQFTSDDAPPVYFLYDRPARRGSLLFRSHPSLERYPLAKIEPFSFVSRDGLTIHGYLSFPPGRGRERLPAVLYPHGGPWARDFWVFAPWTQFMPTRGYLCVQVNFRGSLGYGKSFVNAGNKEWGAKMQDDLVDAVRHVVEEGYADPDRIAIFGASYGGYAALAGAAFTPDLFRCAVSMVGPSSIPTFLRSIPLYWEPIRAVWSRRVGDPETDGDMLLERSPLSKIDEIKIPLLIAQGANDPRVNQAESEQIVAALAERGIEHSYLLFPDEGHGFVKPENNLRFFGAMEEFLARQLGTERSTVRR